MIGNEMLKLLLETQLIQLKKSSDFWIAGGIVLILIGGFYLIFVPFLPCSIPLIFIGTLVLIKGISLHLAWNRIHGAYMRMLAIEHQMIQSQLSKTSQ